MSERIGIRTPYASPVWGLKNQTDSDADMPLRVISYDGAEYRAQLIRDISSQDGGDDDIISTKKRRDVKAFTRL